MLVDAESYLKCYLLKASDANVGLSKMPKILNLGKINCNQKMKAI